MYNKRDCQDPDRPLRNAWNNRRAYGNEQVKGRVSTEVSFT